MFRNYWLNCVTALSLGVLITGCPGEDDENDTQATLTTTATATATDSGTDTNDTNDTNDTDPSTTDDPTTTTDDPTTTTDDPTTTTDPGTTGGECAPTDECMTDEQCDMAAGETCVGCVCFGGSNDESTGGVPENAYGPCDPNTGCEAPLTPAGIAKDGGCFCSPSCDGQGSMCRPAPEGDSMAVCALIPPGGGPNDPPELCALICDLKANNCPTGMDCEDTGQGVGICTHPL